MFHSDIRKQTFDPQKENKTKIHCKQVVCEAAQRSPTYSKKWELGNGMSTTSQISTSYSMKLIHETYNRVVKIDFNVTLRKIQCI